MSPTKGLESNTNCACNCAHAQIKTENTVNRPAQILRWVMFSISVWKLACYGLDITAIRSDALNIVFLANIAIEIAMFIHGIIHTTHDAGDCGFMTFILPFKAYAADLYVGLYAQPRTAYTHLV